MSKDDEYRCEAKSTQQRPTDISTLIFLDLQYPRQEEA